MRKERTKEEGARVLQSGHMAEEKALRQALEETKHALDLANLGFDQSVDSDLIEFYLFEISALRARHSYLLRRIKTLYLPPEQALMQEPLAP